MGDITAVAEKDSVIRPLVKHQGMFNLCSLVVREYDAAVHSLTNRRVPEAT